MHAADVAPLIDRAVGHLREALARERSFSRARAAEVMLWTGLDAVAVREAFLGEVELAEPKWRVVVWRVLAQCSADAAERRRWEGLIRAAAIAPEGPDRTHGIEACAKLRLRGLPPDLHDAAARPGDEQAFARWALANGGGAVEEGRLAELLRAERPQSRLVSAYALCFLPKLHAASNAAVLAALASEPATSVPRPYLIAAAHVHAQRAGALRGALEACLLSGTSEQATMALTALARRPDPELMPLVTGLLGSLDVDVRTRAAHVVLLAGVQR
jgi:hypothetical protein